MMAAGTIEKRIARQFYLDRRKRWAFLANLLQTGFIVLGTTATVASIVLATFTVELGDTRVKIVSFLVAVSLGLMTAFDIRGKTNDVRKAWRLMNEAILAYESNPDFSEEDLRKQYLAGEDLIGDLTYVTPQVK